MMDTDRIKWLDANCGCKVFATVDTRAKSIGLFDQDIPFEVRHEICTPKRYEIETNPECKLHLEVQKVQK